MQDHGKAREADVRIQAGADQADNTWTEDKGCCLRSKGCAEEAKWFDSTKDQPTPIGKVDCVEVASLERCYAVTHFRGLAWIHFCRPGYSGLSVGTLDSDFNNIYVMYLRFWLEERRRPD